MRTPQTNDIRWIVGGAVSILIVGMLIVAFIASYTPGDNTAIITAIASMVTLGVGGVFGLSKLNEVQKERVDGVSEKIAENTAITEDIQHSLNGGLDARMKACAEQAIVDAMPMFRAEMLDVLNEFTRPR